jgi:hypothetical protein
LIIALVLFLLGVLLVMRNDCRMPWAKCGASSGPVAP